MKALFLFACLFFQMSLSFGEIIPVDAAVDVAGVFADNAVEADEAADEVADEAADEAADATEGVSTFEIMVVADRVNLRNEATLESDVVGQVNYGDTLLGLELKDDWVRIRPPAAMAVWVHGGLLFEDREVRARVLNMRSGPGTQFNVLGQLERMDAVRVVERYDEWRRIEPTDAVQVWIYRELVQFQELPVEADAADQEDANDIQDDASDDASDEDPPADVEIGIEADLEEDAGTSGVPELPVAEVDPLPLTEVEAVPEVVTVEAEAPVEEVVAAPEGVNLVPLEGQGTASVRRGWVKAYLIAGSAPSRFQLVYRERGREEALAYLRGDEEVIRGLVGQPVLVRGRDFWVAGQRVPLMRIETIERVVEPGR